MATEYSITYTYTGQANITAASTPMIVPKDKFSLSGDTDKHIGKIKKIVHKHYHTSTEYPTWQLYSRMQFGNGSVIESDTVSHKFSRDVFQYVNTFTDGLPSASVFDTWTQVSIIEANTPSTGELYWRATPTQPMELIVYFEAFPPVYRYINGAWVEQNVEGIYAYKNGVWLPVDEIAKV